MEIKVSSIVYHGNGNRAGSVQVLFKVVRDREYKNMMATIFCSNESGYSDPLAPTNVVNLDKLTDKLDPDYFRLIHKAVAQWDDSWNGSYTQKFPFTVSD